MTCSEFRPYLQAYVDSELSPERAISVERHLSECTECFCEVEITRSVCQATRASVVEVPMCPEFRARLCQCLSDERKRQEIGPGQPLSWRVIAPLAAAASVALFFGVADKQNNSTSTAAITFENPVEFLVQNHTSSREPEMREKEAVQRLEPRLGFPIHPPNFDRFGAEFEGAELVHLKNTRMAALRYRLAGRRVTLYVYDPDELPLRAQRALEPQVVGSRAVFVGNKKGYSIASCEQQGVGYAVTTDLSREESAELVAAAY